MTNVTETDALMLKRDRISTDYATDAMAIFECCLDESYSLKGPFNGPLLEFFYQGEGICMARSNIVEFTQWVRVAWTFAQENGDYPYSFDLDFVPAFMDKVLELGLDYWQWMNPNSKFAATTVCRAFAQEIVEDAA